MLRFDLNALWTVINILIIYFLVQRFLFKPVNNILAARKAEIDKQFADAEQTREEAAQIKRSYEAELAQAAEEKSVLLGDARNKAGREYERIVSDAREQAEKILENAQAAAQQEQEKRLRQAQEQIADLVVSATAKLVASKTNAEEDRELYNRFLNKASGKSCEG